MFQASGVQASDGKVTSEPFEPTYVKVFDAIGWPYAAEYNVRAAPFAGRKPWLAEPRAELFVAA